MGNRMRKIFVAFAIPTILAVSLCACSAETEESTAGTSSVGWETIEESKEIYAASDATTESAETTVETGISEISDSGTTKETSDETAVASMPEAYAEILDIVRTYAWNQENIPEEYKTYVAGEFAMGYMPEYVLVDINLDGIEELVLAASHEEWKSEFVYAIWTLQNEQAFQVLSYGGERNRYYIGTDGTILYESSGSAAESSWNYYKLVGTAIILQEGVYTEPDPEDQTKPCWYHRTDDTTAIEISAEEAREVIDSYAKQELHMTTLTNT